MKQPNTLFAVAFTACTTLSTSAAAQDDTTLECFVEPEMTIELSSAIDGVVSAVNVDKSDVIKRGQALVMLESSLEQATVALARSRAEMREDIEAARIQYNLTKRKKERMQELFKKKSVPGLEKDEAEAAAALAQVELNRATKKQKLAALELKRAKADLALRTLTSPIDGIVVERFVHPGESVKDKPLLKLAQIDPMRVEIIADSALLGRVRPGMQAQITVEGPTETRHTATVTLVDSIVDAASGTFGIRLSLPNPQRKIVGGLRCRAQFQLAP